MLVSSSSTRVLDTLETEVSVDMTINKRETVR